MLNRRHFTAQRRKLTAKQRQACAKKASLYLPQLARQLPKGANIGLYQDDFGELPTFVLLAFCQKYGYRPHLPMVVGCRLNFVPIYPKGLGLYAFHQQPKKRHCLGMYEPIGRQYQPASAMDMIFCPLVAVDRQGVRLGMGGGFYDRTLANYQGKKVGWCYAFQVVDKLSAKPWDIAMDYIVCDTGLIITKNISA